MRNLFFSAVLMTLFSVNAFAAQVKEGAAAPLFSAKDHEGKTFDLAARKGKWTVLFFYPKAQTPGCTKQACAFRDNIKKIRDLGGDVFGISADDVEDQAAFHKKEKLNFTLLADPELKVISLYEAKMPVVNFARRWTFLIDPELVIRSIDKDVDPVMDAKKVAEKIQSFKK